MNLNKNFLTIMMIMSLRMSKPLYVFDNRNDLNKYISLRKSMLPKHKTSTDDGVDNSQDDSDSSQNKLFSCECNCSCPKCPKKPNSCGHHGEHHDETECENHDEHHDENHDEQHDEHHDENEQNEEEKEDDERPSNESEIFGSCGVNSPSKHVVKVTEFVQHLSEFRMKTKYCIISKFSDKVLKLRNPYLFQENLLDCSKGSRFIFKELERKDGHLVTKIYDEETKKYLVPQYPSNKTAYVISAAADPDDYTQKWKIVPNQGNGIDEGFFHVESLISNSALDVNNFGHAASYIFVKPPTYQTNQTFSFKVVER